MRLVLGVAFALVLTACGGAEEPGPVTLPPVQSPTAASPSPSPSPSPTMEPPPAMPALAREHTAEGASAFATFFFDTASYSFRTADPAPLEALSGPECKSCAVLVRLVNELADKGQRREGGDYQTILSASPDLGTGKDAIVDYQYTRSAARIVNTDGSFVRSQDAVERVSYAVGLEWNGFEWTTFAFAETEGPQ